MGCSHRPGRPTSSECCSRAPGVPTTISPAAPPAGACTGAARTARAWRRSWTAPPASSLTGCPKPPSPRVPAAPPAGPSCGDGLRESLTAFGIPPLKDHRNASIDVMAERVLVAPDSFKGSLPATEVAARVAAGLRRAGFAGEIVQIPVADGGEGTVEAAVSAGYRRVELGVRGPTGRPVTAAFGLLDGIAVIEAAQACGLSRLPSGTPAPLTATSRGVGELDRKS